MEDTVEQPEVGTLVEKTEARFLRSLKASRLYQGGQMTSSSVSKALEAIRNDKRGDTDLAKAIGVGRMVVQRVRNGTDKPKQENIEKIVAWFETITSDTGVPGRSGLFLHVDDGSELRNIKNTSARSAIGEAKVGEEDSSTADSEESSVEEVESDSSTAHSEEAKAGEEESDSSTPDSEESSVEEVESDSSAADSEESSSSNDPVATNNNDTTRRHERLQEIFIPVHGFVWLSEAELEIIDHPAFQRLGRVKQLGLAYIVYRGATHTRFEHTIGVLHITQRIIDALSWNRRRTDFAGALDDPSESCKWGKELTDTETRFIRLGGLLHDIGHVPFGHSLEDELHILNEHDGEDRLRLVFEDFDASPYQGQFLADIINEQYSLELNELKSIEKPITPVELLTSIIIRDPVTKHKAYYRDLLKEKDATNQPITDDSVRKAYTIDLAHMGVRLDVCCDIVGNTICADLLDYLHRDWHHVGRTKHFEDRVFHYMELRTDDNVHKEPDADIAALDPRDRFVINLGRYPRLRTDAVSLILDLLESRYNLAEAVLFHRSKLKLTAMLERCLRLTFKEPGDDVSASPDTSTTWWDQNLEKNLLHMGEDTFLDELCKRESSLISRQLKDEEIEQRFYLANCIRDRHLFKHVHTITYTEGRPEAIIRFQELHAEGAKAPNKREAALRQVESDFGLETGELVMYCPQRAMNSKIAEVKILVGGELHQLDKFDASSTQKLAAGHLSAQLERFTKLWLVTFLVDPRIGNKFSFDEEEFREWRRLMADYIQAFLVGTWQGKDIHDARASVVKAMSRSEVFLKVFALKREKALKVGREPILIAARREKVGFYVKNATRNDAKGHFPSGASSFWYYVREEEN